MTGETTPEIHLSFEDLGSAIDAYKEKRWAHFEAEPTNHVHDEEGFATITGQDLEDWKQEFPRIDDEEVARLQGEHEKAEAHLIDTLGLIESPVVLPALLETYENERLRRLEDRVVAQNRDNPYRTAITIQSADSSIGPRDMIAGAIAMSKITGETYTMHAGFMTGKTYNYAYATIEPTHEVDDVAAQYKEQGLAV